MKDLIRMITFELRGPMTPLRSTREEPLRKRSKVVATLLFLVELPRELWQAAPLFRHGVPTPLGIGGDTRKQRLM